MLSIGGSAGNIFNTFIASNEDKKLDEQELKELIKLSYNTRALLNEFEDNLKIKLKSIDYETWLFKEYLEIASPLQSNKEVINKKNRYDNHIKSFIGHLELSDIKYKDCQKIVNEAIFTKELSPKTAKYQCYSTNCFNYAIRNEYTDKNPTVKSYLFEV